MNGELSALVKYKLDLQSLFGLLLCTAVLIGWDHAINPPPPPPPTAFGLVYEDAIGLPI